MSKIDLLKENMSNIIYKSTSLQKDVNYKFHHNTCYKYGKSILKHGILSINDLRKEGLIDISNSLYMNLCDIESHVNGTNSVSLSMSGLTDLYKDEEEFDNTLCNSLDFLIGDNVSARRNSIHYGNEFLSDKSIPVSDIKGIDVRFLNYINKCNDINLLIEEYNHLKDIARYIRDNNMNITLRERSCNLELELDADKLIDIPMIIK